MSFLVVRYYFSDLTYLQYITYQLKSALSLAVSFQLNKKNKLKIPCRTRNFVIWI